jgi:dipeptide/tripeptide permease
MMGIHSLPMLYFAMTGAIVGNGFFKPNISTLLGNSTTKTNTKKRKTSCYNISIWNSTLVLLSVIGAALQILLG